MKQTFKSTCCYCGVGCGILLSKDSKGQLTLTGDPDHPSNRGMLCSKGMNLHHTVADRSDRLLFPEMRHNRFAPRKRVSWDEAMERTAAVFRALIEKYGPDSVAFYASGQCLTEEYYVINKLIKGFIGSNNMDTNSRLCMSSAVVGYKMSLGEDSVPVCYDDLELADCIFVAGANPAWCHPIIWRRIEAAKEANPNLKIIVSDPRRTQSCAIADLHLQLNPGTDVVLHHAIGRCLIEQGWVDDTFLNDHTEGFGQYRQQVFQRTLASAAEICGVPEADIRLAAAFIGKAKAFMTLWTMGLNQSVIGVQKNLSLINLNLITGQIGKPGAGPFSLTGQPNAMGGREVGGLANLLPAHRDLANPAHRAEVERFWGSAPGTIQPKPGLSATEMFQALEAGTLKAIWIICTNPLVSLPDVRLAEAALKNARFVVVQDISNRAETLPYADVVLPAAAWTEKEGTMTNAERRITYLDKVFDPPGEALSDAEIICRFARKMGFRGFDFPNFAAIYAEHAALTAGTSIDVSGLNYEILKKKRSVQWPYPVNAQGNGTQRLFTDRQFHTPSRKAFIHAVPDENQSEQPDDAHPLILTTGRIRDQWHTMSKTGKVNKLKSHLPHAFLEMHPGDAARRAIRHDDLTEVDNRRGSVRVKAVLTEDIKEGVVFLPMHWGKILGSDLNRANNLTNNLVDPRSKEPDFKFSAVQVRRYEKPRQKIIVIGAGAGAVGFVKSYRLLNATDSIVVFSKENHPFYNRVLLPDYVSEALCWESLVKMDEAEERAHGIELHRGVSIESIDRTNKTVSDSRGQRHDYDILVISTGSRAILPRELPNMDGIFTMRSRADADRFKQYLDPQKSKVVVVGGGLLGIEMAASLRAMGAEVTIVQRISRLMDRQLDPLGSQLLHEELREQGIEIYYNDEIDRVQGKTSVSGIRLKSGLRMACSAILVAVGTAPNIELAQRCGLHCQRGVVVNEYLQTSDPSIFAIGEVAEFKGMLYGITAAAEQQAAIVASCLSGDISRCYEGSLLMNILKVHGADVCSLGLVECPDEPGYEEIVFLDKAKRYYKKCIVHQDRLVGVILIGDKNEFLDFRGLIENKTELSDKRLQLLRSGKQMEPVMGKLVCSCNNVGHGNLEKKIREGCADLVQLCQLTGAGMGCGSCRTEVKAVLESTVNGKFS